MAIAVTTQDVAADEYAVEHLPPGLQPRGAAIAAGPIGILLGAR